MVFIPLVEDAFKHGIGIESNDIETGMVLRILETGLEFRIRNSKAEKQRPQ